jgi:hypothetical protein
MTASGAQVPNDCGVLFHELLYALCERKCGKPMPKANTMCQGVRERVGLGLGRIVASYYCSSTS